MPTRDAKRDLNIKLRLERRLLKPIRTFDAKIVQEFVKNLSRTGVIFDATQLNDELSGILNEHYFLTESAFSSRIRDAAPADIDFPDDVDDKITAALSSFFAARAPDQADRINQTTNDNMRDALDDATEEMQAALLEGRRIEAGGMAAIAAASLGRRLRSREPAIVMFETQAAAEAAKLTEAQILLGESPTVVVGSARKSNVKKQWVTVSDSLVRQTHRDADFTKADINDPYTVGGQQLMYPGDTSLGATLDNVINCRCSSVVDKGQIYDAIRGRG